MATTPEKKQRKPGLTACKLCKAGPKRIDTRRDPDTRTQRAQTFRATYASLGLSIDDVAKLLHVTRRTLHNWNSGRYDIPYAALKLLRVLLRYEIPDARWQGWSFSGGKLYTPEGYSIAPDESGWWTLLVRRSQLFDAMAARCKGLEQRLKVQADAAEAVGRASEAPASDGAAVAGSVSPDTARRAVPGLDLSLEHFGTQIEKTEERRGFQPGAMVSLRVVNSSHHEKGPV